MGNAILWYEIKNIGSFEEEGGFVDLTTTAKDKKRSYGLMLMAIK